MTVYDDFYLLVIVNATATGTANVTAGDTHTLRCSTGGTRDLTVSYQWVEPNGNTVIDQPIILNPVTTVNAGTYTCTATVSHSNEYVNIQPMMPSGTATLSVKSKSFNMCYMYIILYLL